MSTRIRLLVQTNTMGNLYTHVGLCIRKYREIPSQRKTNKTNIYWTYLLQRADIYKQLWWSLHILWNLECSTRLLFLMFSICKTVCSLRAPWQLNCMYNIHTNMQRHKICYMYVCLLINICYLYATRHSSYFDIPRPLVESTAKIAHN